MMEAHRIQKMRALALVIRRGFCRHTKKTHTPTHPYDTTYLTFTHIMGLFGGEASGYARVYMIHFLVKAMPLW